MTDVPRKSIAQVTKNTGKAFSSHDLKRTFLTIAEAVHLPETLIKRLANHATDGNVTNGYIITEADTMREAINRIADYIQRIVISSDSNVVTFKKA